MDNFEKATQNAIDTASAEELAEVNSRLPPDASANSIQQALTEGKFIADEGNIPMYFRVLADEAIDFYNTLPIEAKQTGMARWLAFLNDQSVKTGKLHNEF